MKKSIYNILILGFISTILLLSLYVLQIPPHIGLLLCTGILLVIGRIKKIKWNFLEQSMSESILQAIQPIFNLSLVGILIGVWMMSGTVPTILYYGLKYMSPNWFYINSIILCMIASTFNGSAITIVSTIGVALIGIAKGLGLPLHIAAGAIINGACFGDKCSPLSETTNLAPGILKIDLYTHVKHLVWTTVPSMFITILIYGYIGFNSPTPNVDVIKATSLIISEHFNISLLTLISPLLILVLAIFRVPALANFSIGIISSLIITFFIQKNADIKMWSNVMQNGYLIKNCDDPLIIKLVNRGGLQSMMWSISLIGIALSFGGLLKRVGIIDNLLSTLSNKIVSKGFTILAASLSCIFVNFLSGEQFLSIILPGRAFKSIFTKKGIALKNLSRTLEDCGTLINPLVPWGVSGAIFTSALGVSVTDYAPYAFFLYLSPIFTVLFGFIDKDRELKKSID